jgi:hypothetical protein
MKPVVKKYLMAREKARESVRFVIVFISFFVGQNGFARNFNATQAKFNRNPKNNQLLAAPSRQRTAEAKPAPLETSTRSWRTGVQRRIKKVKPLLLLDVTEARHSR